MTGKDDQGNVEIANDFLRFYLDTQPTKTSFSTLHVPFLGKVPKSSRGGGAQKRGGGHPLSPKMGGV